METTDKKYTLVKNSLTKHFYPNKKQGLQQTQKTNTASGITTFGVSYEKIINEFSDEYFSCCVAGKSWDNIKDGLLDISKEAYENGYKTLFCVNLFDKTQQDWNSYFWKYGYGGEVLFVKKDNINEKNFFETLKNEIVTAVKECKKQEILNQGVKNDKN